MKKILAILLALCLLLALTACGEEEEPETEQGIQFVNGFDWTLTEVYVVPSDESEWGNALFESMDAGDQGYLYAEARFGSREVVVDILAYDEDNDQFSAMNIVLKDGDTVMLQLDEEYNFAVYVNETEKYTGEWLRGDTPDEPVEPDVPDEPVVEGPVDFSETDVTGFWDYADYDAWLVLKDDATWAIYNGDAGLVAEGYQSDSLTQLDLYDDNHELYDILYVTDMENLPLGEGILRSDNMGLLYFQGGLDDPEYAFLLDAPQEAWFEQLGYGVNYALGDGAVKVNDAAFAYSDDSGDYGTFPATVSLELLSYNDTRDGYVEIELAETIFLDAAEYPSFTFLYNYVLGMEHGLFDYYTGYQLQGHLVQGDSSRGENHAYYEYESLGRTICVDYNYSTNWQPLNDNSYLYESVIFVRMPADYDGILYGLVDSYPDYDTYIGRGDPGDSFVTLPDWYKYALFCQVNHPTSGGSSSNSFTYEGIYDTSDGYLRIYSDGTFDVAFYDGETYNYGTYSADADGITLATEGGDILFFVLDEYGNLFGGEDVGTLPRVDPSTISTLGASLDTFLAGDWYYSDQGAVLSFYTDGTYLWDFGDYVEYGTYVFDGAWVEFESDGEGETWGEAYYNAEEDILICTGDAGSYYYRSEDF